MSSSDAIAIRWAADAVVQLLVNRPRIMNWASGSVLAGGLQEDVDRRCPLALPPGVLAPGVAHEGRDARPEGDHAGRVAVAAVSSGHPDGRRSPPVSPSSWRSSSASARGRRPADSCAWMKRDARSTLER
ncbi:hypothetical protein [Naasia sp. SYSU D00948]|uniref:hypothetical protein n=1 Tax=Naasia sp. SYSU D00948 TaxID=2817379 RepID=UPI001B316A0F|nr:hypothetical protein [Naasia sp. SYSU D00948]